MQGTMEKACATVWHHRDQLCSLQTVCQAECALPPVGWTRSAQSALQGKACRAHLSPVPAQKDSPVWMGATHGTPAAAAGLAASTRAYKSACSIVPPPAACTRMACYQCRWPTAARVACSNRGNTSCQQQLLVPAMLQERAAWHATMVASCGAFAYLTLGQNEAS